MIFKFIRDAAQEMGPTPLHSCFPSPQKMHVFVPHITFNGNAEDRHRTPFLMLVFFFMPHKQWKKKKNKGLEEEKNGS